MAMMRWADAPPKTVTWGENRKQEETRFLWDGFRLLHARYADRTESYVYDQTVWSSPLARITQQPGARDGDIRWFNTELNGAPLEMTDAEGAVRWSGDYGSFGAVNGQAQDLIGLAGGINLYTYAPNTLGWEDPLALSKECGLTKRGVNILNLTCLPKWLRSKGMLKLFIIQEVGIMALHTFMLKVVAPKQKSVKQGN